MASDASSNAEWAAKPPAAFDIVACYFPESEPKPDWSVKLRPALVLNVYRDKATGAYAVRVAYGTTTLKLMQRGHIDLIIQNAAELRIIGLPMATRFDLDNTVMLPWTPTYFGCWSGYPSPLIATLTEDYVKELAWLFTKRAALQEARE